MLETHARYAVDQRTAMLMYAHENKGYLPAPRVSTPYSVNGILFDRNAAADVPGEVVAENAKWWHFLGKYLTKESVMAQTATDADTMKKGVFWCSSFDGFVDGGNAENLVGGFNRNFTGMGMNWWPMFSAADLGPFNGNGFPSGARQVERFSDPTGGNTGGTGQGHLVQAGAVQDSRRTRAACRLPVVVPRSQNGP